MSTKAEQKYQDMTDAADTLRAFIAKDATVYTNLQHVSRSGMSRSISVLVVSDGDIVNLSPAAARALQWPQDHKNGGVKVSGAGMDMGFHLVYSLATVLYGEGYALKHRWV